MSEITMGQVEARFAGIIWDREPVTASELARLAAAELGWKKTTSYTVLRRLCDKGIFKNDGGTVTSLLSREDFQAMQSRQTVDAAFGGSLPAFVAAFTRGRGLSEAERAELRALIDGKGER